MTYAATARAFVRARETRATWSADAADLDTITRGVPRHQASGYDPNDTARAHAQHVEAKAQELRAALSETNPGEGWAMPAKDAARLAGAALALLVAIGEGEA